MIVFLLVLVGFGAFTSIECSESHCGPGEFECDIFPACFNNSHICDSVLDCPQGEDEINCTGSIRILGAEYVERGQPIRLTCNATSHGTNTPAEDIDWFKDGDHFSGTSNSDRTSIATYPVIGTRTLLSILEVRDSRMVDSGTYVCRSSQSMITSISVRVLNTSQNNTRRGCPTGSLRCSQGNNCVPAHFLCDGDNDCSDGEDERNCTGVAQTCSEAHFVCSANQRCIPSTWLCDGDRDCPDREDERDCDDETRTCAPGLFQCTFNRLCIPAAWVCDGEHDCVDGEDEANCTSL